MKLTTQNKKTLLIGAAGIGGLGLVFSFFRKPSAAQQASTVANGSQSGTIAVPQYPSNPINVPPIEAINSPAYITLNVPQGTPPPAASNQSSCDACDTCNDRVNTTGPVLTQEFSDRQIAALRFMTSTTNNLRSQFPPNLYPWMYYDGKH